MSEPQLIPVRPDIEINDAFHSWIKRDTKLAHWILFLESRLREVEPWFVCPKCGGSHFGTHDVTATPIIRTCHDEFGVGCKWRGEYKSELDKILPEEVDHERHEGA